MNTARTLASLLASGATAALLTAIASNTLAAPDTGSASGSSGCGTRSSADQLFLNSYAEAYDTCGDQDAAIQLARRNAIGFAHTTIRPTTRSSSPNAPARA